MRLITFVQGSAGPRVGALRAANGHQTIVDLHGVDARLPSDMIGLLRAGAGVDLAEVTLKAPVLHPKNSAGALCCRHIEMSSDACHLPSLRYR